VSQSQSRGSVVRLGAERLFPGDSELAHLMRRVEWANTPVGSPETWPSSLKTAIRIMLTSRQPMWIGWGQDLTYLYNDAYKSIIGRKHPWALGLPISVVWREVWDDIGPMLAQASRGREGTYVEAQLLIMERNGYPEETYYTFSYSPIITDDETVGGIFCANTDDTQRVIGERELGLLRELAAETAPARTWQDACRRSGLALATNSRDLPFAMIYMLDESGRTATLSGVAGIEPSHPAAPATLSVDSAMAWPLTPGHRGPRIVAELAKLFGCDFPSGIWGQPPREAVVFPIPSSGETGRTGFLIAGLNPFRLFDDNYAGFLDLVARQIGAAVANAEAYEQERRRADALVTLDNAKTVFFSNISHEFRTPITLMLSPLEDILAESGNEASSERRELIRIAHSNALRLLKLVNALLDFSRIEAGRLQARYEPVDISAFTAELASTFRSALDKAGLRLRVDCPPLPVDIHVDRDMFEKIILNLLSNAFKFTFTGELSVEVRANADATTAVVVIRDTGVGIPREELPHLFERFHRVKGARGRSIEGSGIGLALVWELVRLHGGAIHVESEVDKGSAFIVSLPFGTAHLPADKLVAHSDSALTPVRAHAYVDEAVSWLGGEKAAALVPASGPQDLNLPVGRRDGESQLVLLADDNFDMRSYVERLLRLAGYSVKSVADGQAALSAARELKPDLVLTDIMMPELDGFELLAKLRAEEELKGTPVILLSARAGEEAKIEGLRAGADDYLIKPFAARELLARVETNLQLARTRRDAARSLRDEAQTLEALNRVGVAIAAELDLDKTVQVVTDAAKQLSGAAYGVFFSNVAAQRGESRKLYAQFGASREAIASFPRLAVFGPVPAAGVVRSPDITNDPRFGRNPRSTLDEQLLVRSYLAAPVVSRTGEVLGGLFLGHPEPDVFDVRAERVVSAISVQAGIAIDKARLYQAAQEEIRRRKQTEAALRESEHSLEHRVTERTAELAAANERLIREAADRERAEGRFQHLVEAVVDYALFTLDTNGIISTWNTGAERIKGYRAAEIVGRHFACFYTEEDRAAGVPARALAVATKDGKFEAEGWRVRKDGSRFWASVVINVIRDKRGNVIGFVKITRDVTERREAQKALARAQEQLAQAQKMEGIGQLTGGVAHDFNNLLTIIIGNLEILQRVIRSRPTDTQTLARSTEHAMRGAQRAAALTQQLLAFSRMQPLNPGPVDVNRLVTAMSELLRRTLGEQIAIETVLAAGLWQVFVDSNQLEVSIINLAVNARDAMQAGGKLTIETANVSVDETYAASQVELGAGEYAVLCITDTGAGMTREVRARAFDPFFTTKDFGQGTGLGLSQVYGFVKQSGGHIKLYSELGHGTTVKLYLPRHNAPAGASTETELATVAPNSARGEAILVVEDDDDVREYTTGILRELGYTVLEAPNAAIALHIAGGNSRIDLLFTDVGLPGGVNGKHLAEAVRKRRPHLRVLFASGYARDAIVHDGRLDPGVLLITKPFTYAALASKIRDVLETDREPSRILVVEYEELVRRFAADCLQELGYKVETAISATEAINKIRRVNGGFDLVIIDVGLPDHQGDRLVHELLTFNSRLAIAIASGANVRDLGHLTKANRVDFLQKPYSKDQLRAVASRYCST
jgi:PAS domain S-box-containing protein